MSSLRQGPLTPRRITRLEALQAANPVCDPIWAGTFRGKVKVEIITIVESEELYSPVMPMPRVPAGASRRDRKPTALQLPAELAIPARKQLRIRRIRIIMRQI